MTAARKKHKKQPPSKKKSRVQRRNNAILDLKPFRFKDHQLRKHKLHGEAVYLPLLNLASAKNAKQRLVHWAAQVLSVLSEKEVDAQAFALVTAMIEEPETREEWKKTCETEFEDNDPYDVDNLKRALQLFVQKFMDPDDRASQMNWFRDPKQCQKGSSVSCLTYKQQLLWAIQLMKDWVPGEAEFTDSDVKRVFSQGMPRRWQRQFQHTWGQLEDKTLDTVLTYYTRLERSRGMDRRKQLPTDDEDSSLASDAASSSDEDSVSSLEESNASSVRQHRKKSRKEQPKKPKPAAREKLNYCHHPKCQADGFPKHLWYDCPRNPASHAHKANSRTSTENAHKRRNNNNDREPEEEANIANHAEGSTFDEAAHNEKLLKGQIDAMYADECSVESRRTKKHWADMIGRCH